MHICCEHWGASADALRLSLLLQMPSRVFRLLFNLGFKRTLEDLFERVRRSSSVRCPMMGRRVLIWQLAHGFKLPGNSNVEVSVRYSVTHARFPHQRQPKSPRTSLQGRKHCSPQQRASSASGGQFHISSAASPTSMRMLSASSTLRFDQWLFPS